MRDLLLAWYDRCARDLPWRRRKDAYGIWLSEIMLQQTQVETVRERYRLFLREFPSVEALAASTEERVCEAWAGLGYYRRARHLYRAARVVALELGGCFPTTARELAELPGVGAYTAAAIASMAFEQRVAAVDGNLVRVLARVHALPGRADEASLRRAVALEATVLVDGPRPGDVNQALMDVGATVCTPRAPRCPVCPLAAGCAARREGDPSRYPAAARRPAPRELVVAMAWLEDGAGVRLRRRSLDGLWAGLWELPSAEGPEARAELSRSLGARPGKVLATVEHQLTHRTVRATVYRVARIVREAGLVAWPVPEEAPLSGLARRALAAVREARREATPRGPRKVSRRPRAPRR